MSTQKSNEVKNYICEKFSKFAESRSIKVLGTPSIHKVRIFSSKSSSQHMAVAAEKNNQKGWIINVADGKLEFFSRNLAHCNAIGDGKVTAGKRKAPKSQPVMVSGGVYFKM